jgi:hypothetical protein
VVEHPLCGVDADRVEIARGEVLDVAAGATARVEDAWAGERLGEGVEERAQLLGEFVGCRGSANSSACRS